jgi:hypothetical protein
VAEYIRAKKNAMKDWMAGKWNVAVETAKDKGILSEDKGLSSVPKSQVGVFIKIKDCDELFNRGDQNTEPYWMCQRGPNGRKKKTNVGRVRQDGKVHWNYNSDTAKSGFGMQFTNDQGLGPNIHCYLMDENTMWKDTEMKHIYFDISSADEGIATAGTGGLSVLGSFNFANVKVHGSSKGGERCRVYYQHTKGKHESSVANILDDALKGRDDKGNKCDHRKLPERRYFGMFADEHGICAKDTGSADDCKGGHFISSYCKSSPADVKCCLKIPCNDGVAGTCVDIRRKNACPTAESISGKCKGAGYVKCCPQK